MKIFRVIDFETTGFPPTAGIVEIAWTDVLWRSTSMEIGTTQAILTNPQIPIEVGAMAVHHITQKELEGQPHPDDILVQLDHECDFIVAHNLKFEQAFWTIRKPTICTLKCARQLIPDVKGHKNQELRYHLNMQLDPLKAMPPHRAGPDTYVTAHLLIELLKLSAKQGGDFVGRLVQISNEQTLLGTIPFGKYRGQRFADIAITDPGYLRWIIGNPQAEPDVLFTAKHYLNQK